MKRLSVITSCYRGEKYLPDFFRCLEGQTAFGDVELVFVANDPTEKELTLVRDFSDRHPGSVNLLVVPREPLPVSINRAIRAANGEFIANWDTDDIRTPESLELQLRALSDPGVALAYGDFVVVREFGGTVGTYVKSPDFDRSLFLTGMHCGSFRAWRKSVHEVVGYCDEQLLSGADFDLMIRIASRYVMKKADGLLGYYTNMGAGISTRQSSLVSVHEKELQVINRRHRILSKLDFVIGAPAGYRVDQYMLDGKFVPVGDSCAHFGAKMGMSDFFGSLCFTARGAFFRLAKYAYLSLKKIVRGGK